MDGGEEFFFGFCDSNETFIFMSKFSMEACPQMKYELVVQRKEGHIFNRLGVAGAVLQSPPSFIHSFIHLLS